jgi:hypothetical protein
MSQPHNWSTTYNSQYRDRRRYISPHPGTSDDSWSTRTQSYYGTRASLAEHAARSAELNARAPWNQTGPLGATVRGNYNVTTNSNGNYTERAKSSSGLVSAPVHYRTANFQLPSVNNGSYTSRYDSRDLWTTPIEQHSGIYSNATTIRGGVNPKTFSQTSRQILYDNTGAVGYEQNDYNYEQNCSSTTRCSTGNSNSPWNKQHIPGYRGFVRGSQFTQGNTYGTTTRLCLSVPTDVPLEP